MRNKNEKNRRKKKYENAEGSADGGENKHRI